MDDLLPLRPASVVVAAGRPPAEPGEPLSVPPVLASVYTSGLPVGYGRVDNPTWQALESVVAALEGGGSARAFASGMAAAAAALTVLTDGPGPGPGRPPPEGLPGGPPVVVAPPDAYTGARAHLRGLVERGRIELRVADVADTDATLAACEGAAVLWAESPTNPLLAVADLPALVAGAHARGARVAVDNTFATPLLQRPLDLGADLVVHSATKLLSGHSDVLMGIVVTRDPALSDAVHDVRTDTGGVPGPFEAWLALRGLRTLALRQERAQANADILAHRLAEHPAVGRVRYPGLRDDPGHARAAAQMSGFGTIVSFELSGGAAAADAVCAAVRLVRHATSLGGVETTMERRNVHPGEEDVPPALVRLSVGIEHVEDLWSDLAQALR